MEELEPQTEDRIMKFPDVEDDPFNFLLHSSRNLDAFNLLILDQWTKYVLNAVLSTGKLSYPHNALPETSFG